MLDYDKVSKVKQLPNAHLLLSSLRSVGYSIEAAVSDIIDNSISAQASIIDIFFDWDNKNIVITDNGLGMDRDDLISAMTIGSSDPETERNSFDLGRFGMGMKTAAFSIGKVLTVISKNENILSNATWDLEYIIRSNDWDLLVYPNNAINIANLNSYLSNYEHGTVICISNIDRMITSMSDAQNKRRFFKTIDDVKKHIALVFHRFIEDNELLIRVNGTSIRPWNPFLPGNRAVQELEPEIHDEKGKTISIYPYVLPHKSKFQFDEDMKAAGGYRGWLQHQGIYLYRNKRLIIYGTWFGIIKKEPTFNLARVRIDMNSDSDFDWQIDIKKSKAIPPTYIEETLKRVVHNVTQQSTLVYNSRGTYSKSNNIASQQLCCVWEQRLDNSGKYTFLLNKKHTLLNKLKKSLDDSQWATLQSYMELVEKCSPINISGVTDTMGVQSKFNSLDLENKKFEAKKLISSLKANGYGYPEIKDLFQQLTDYQGILEYFDTIFEEA